MVGQISSLANALSIAVSGLSTTTGLISVASNNIANAQTPGYTEKTASVSAVDYGSSFGGSAITSYGRVTDTALTNNYNTTTTQASYYGTQNTYMTQVQTILDSTASNPTLSDDVAQFASAWTQYASQPDSSVQQQNVITVGEKLANDINTTSSQIGNLQSQVVTDLQSSVGTFSTTLSQIAKLNNQIQTALNAGQQTGSLEDQRDQAINTLATYTSINVQTRSGDQVAVYTTTGQPLVDGSTAQSYTYNGIQISDSQGNSASSVLTGGSLQAQLDFISTTPTATNSTTPGVGVIAKLNSQLSKLVDAFTNGTGTTTSPFASAYTTAYNSSTGSGGTQNGVSVASSFFTTASGTADPSSFQVNSALIAGTSTLPQTGVDGISSSFTATQNYTAAGLSAKSSSYAQLTTSILSTFQQTANTISASSTNATSQQTYYKNAVASATGVNMDDELATLTALQNSYAASAHIISTVESLLTDLIQSIT
jgi:flagellar hook-associated protein 1 FlgK